MLLALAVPAGALGWQSDGGPRVVLLTNGNILVGIPEPQGERVIVWTESGSRLVLARNHVDAVFQSLAGAYQYQRDRLGAAGSTADHLRLYEWCVRHKLWDQAQAQIDRLQFMEVGRVELARLNESLATRRAAESKNPAGAYQVTPQPVGQQDNVAGTSRSTTGAAPDTTGRVQTVSFEEAPRQGQRLLPNEELNAFIERLPPEIVQRYERRMDSILVRNCGNAGCHDARDGTWSLLSVAVGIESPRSMKLQNLVRTLQHVGDRGTPDDSPLIQAMVEVHGGNAQALLAADSMEFRELTEWLREVSRTVDSYDSLRVDLRGKSTTPSHIALPGLPPEPTPANDAIPRSSAHRAPAEPSWSEPKAIPPSPPRLEVDANTFVPRDPFDPEIFNRLYLQRKTPHVNPSASSGNSANR